MTEQEWLECLDPRWMLEHLRKQARSRKLRLFACACARRAESRFTDPICLRAVEVAERFADKQAKNAERERMRQAIRALYPRGSRVTAAMSLALFVTHGTRFTHVDGTGTAERAVFAVTGVENRGDDPDAEDAERAAQADVFRDIFGNPFRPVTIAPNERTASVVSLAQGIYSDRAFDRLPILADALEEAGCTNADILKHCRGEGPHVRGCWVVDLLLGKE